MLTFGVSGKLIMNGLVMYDRETGSLWSQVIGQGVDGEFKGTELTILPALQTTWERWQSEHSNTLVLDKRGRYRSDSYRSYYTDSSKGILGQTRVDNRLNSKELIVGVNVRRTAKAYPFSALRRTPVVNDVVNGVPLLVTFDSVSSTAVVFNPTVGGKRLNFRELPISGKLLMKDLETGTVWEPLTGVALEGPLTGTALEQMASHYEFWFAWKDYRPETELYQGSGQSEGK